MLDWLIGHVTRIIFRAISGEQKNLIHPSFTPLGQQDTSEPDGTDGDMDSTSVEVNPGDASIGTPDTTSTFLRGFRRNDWLADGTVKLDAFLPDARTAARRRSEGLVPLGEETSINWEDSADVVGKTLSDANGQFGAARVERSAIELANKIAKIQVVAWERRETASNPHHGNLIFLDGIDKRKHKAFATAITLNAKPIPPLSGSGIK